jgi:UDP-sugar pyrophosphorylase
MPSFDIESLISDLDPIDRETARLVVALEQHQLLAHWPPSGRETENKRRQLRQIRDLDACYEGGLRGYLDRARDLLAKARRGESPYDGFVPRVPASRLLEFGSDAFLVAAEAGLGVANRCAYVVVAGGLGERLGFKGIKLSLTAETATGRCYLQLYIEHILALQTAANRRFGTSFHAPLVIMTSDETHLDTQRLLEENGFFGLREDRLTLLKQGQVPALRDDRPTIASNLADPWQIQTKPHGHGDIHALLQRSGLAGRWLGEGIRWLVFFQDTNALTFYAVAAALGVSQQEQLDLNSIVVPRRAGEAIGGIARLEGRNRSLTINVEYNQLDALLKASGSPEGDVTDASGYSPYPGNINVLVLGLEDYVHTLERTMGVIPEFVNPKYADATRSQFVSPTRLECMMQDYPKLLAPESKVGVTQFEREICYSAAKNSLGEAARRQRAGLPPECASSAEADLYAMHRKFLSCAGAEIQLGSPVCYSGVEASLFPIVLLSPKLTVSAAHLAHRFSRIRISSRSTLVIDAEEVRIDGLELDGALVIRAVPGARVVIRGLVVRNRGWQGVPLASTSESGDALSIRGFELVRLETRLIQLDEPGEHVITPERLVTAQSLE